MRFYRYIIVLSVLVFAFGLAAPTVSADIVKTRSPEPGVFENELSSSIPGLAAFARSVINNLPDQVAGIYVQGILDFPVVQQPGADSGYVSDLPDTLTQFSMAAQYNTIGLLAHDFLAGAAFPELQPGSDIYLVYGDGSFRTYRVYEVQQYRALSPNDPYSNFMNLSDQTKLSADQLFYLTFGLGNNTLVLQTCISTPAVPSWGRIFVLARPVESPLPTSVWDAFPLVKQILAFKAAY